MATAPLKSRHQPSVGRANTMRIGVILAVLLMTQGLGWALDAAQRPVPGP